jgi:hypothetical protein
MTEVKVGEYRDLKGDQVINSRAKDIVLRELADGAKAVLRLEDWLVEQKSFESVDDVHVDDLFPGRVIAETDKAYLFTQEPPDVRDPDADKPGTDWVPKSCARVYVPKDDLERVDDATPQRGLTDFG